MTHPRAAAAARAKAELAAIAARRILVLDGAMGTMLQRY